MNLCFNRLLKVIRCFFDVGYLYTFFNQNTYIYIYIYIGWVLVFLWVFEMDHWCFHFCNCFAYMCTYTLVSLRESVETRMEKEVRCRHPDGTRRRWRGGTACDPALLRASTSEGRNPLNESVHAILPATRRGSRGIRARVCGPVRVRE